MIGRRGQTGAIAGSIGKAASSSTAKAVGGAVMSGGSSALSGLKVAGSAAGKAGINAASVMGAAGVMAASQATNSLGQSKDALVNMAPSLFAFFLVVFAHMLSTGMFFGSNLFLASVLYTVSFFLIAISIILRKNNKDKFRDMIIVVITFMIMGTVG